MAVTTIICACMPASSIVQSLLKEVLVEQGTVAASEHH